MEEKILEAFKNDICNLIEAQSVCMGNFIREKYRSSSGKKDEKQDLFEITFTISFARAGDDIHFFTTMKL